MVNLSEVELFDFWFSDQNEKKKKEKEISLGQHKRITAGSGTKKKIKISVRSIQKSSMNPKKLDKYFCSGRKVSFHFLIMHVTFFSQSVSQLRYFSKIKVRTMF